MKRENQTITVRLPDDLLARLDAHVGRIRGVRNKEIIKAIQDHLDAQDRIFEILQTANRRRKNG